MKTDCTFTMFCDQFNGSQYDNNFSYDGKKALWEYLEELSDEGCLTDSFDPLDIVALCCDFSEYGSAEEYAKEFGSWEKALDTCPHCGEGILPEVEKCPDCDSELADDYEESALEFLQDNTTVIEFDGGIIAQCF